MKRTEIYFDKSRYIYLSAYAKDLVKLTNELAGTLKRRDLLSISVDMELLHDLLNGGTLVLSSLRSHLQEQKDAMPLLSRAGAETSIETLTDEVGAMVAEFSKKAYIGNDRQPITDRMQCIKVEEETFVYDDERCRTLCSIVLSDAKDIELWERINKIKDEVNALEAEFFERSHTHLISPHEKSLLNFDVETNRHGVEFLRCTLNVYPEFWRM